jgi:hypothetical protein
MPLPARIFRCRRMSGLRFLWPALALILTSSVVHGEVENATVTNQATYPWLMVGAYAKYSGTADYFVTTNGTLLISFASGLPTSPTPSDNLTLDWTVTNRTNALVSLAVAFHVKGCFDSQQRGPACTPFDFAKTLDVQVNVTSGESYVAGQRQGLLNFWEPPLLYKGTIYAGSVFVNGVRFDSLANVSVLDEANPGATLTNVLGSPSGVPAGQFYPYWLTPTLFTSGTSSQFGWLKINGLTYPLGPSGSYDYYNGLAYRFSTPDYPTNQTVCEFNNNRATSCRLTTFATTLGGYFRSGNGIVALVSTNISLAPSGPPVNYTYLALAIVVIVFVTSIGVFALIRTRRQPDEVGGLKRS